MTFSPWNSEIQVANSPGVTDEMVAALPNGGYVVAWRSGSGTFFFKIYNGLGAQVVGPTEIPGGRYQNLVDIQAVGTEGDFAITWNSSVEAKSGFSYKTALFSISGNTVGSPIEFGLNSSINEGEAPAMARNGTTGFVTAYSDGGHVFLAYRDLQGKFQREVEIAKERSYANVDVTEVGPNKFVVTYRSGNGTIKTKIVTDGVAEDGPADPEGTDVDVTALKNSDGSLSGRYAVTVYSKLGRVDGFGRALAEWIPKSACR